jgi:hypothetical protein
MTTPTPLPANDDPRDRPDRVPRPDVGVPAPPHPDQGVPDPEHPDRPDPPTKDPRR